MALSDITSVLSCSLGSALGTGLRGCDFNLENIESIALVPAGTTIPASAAYDRDYIRDLQMQGKWVVLNNVYGATWTPEEDQVETSESKGIESITRKGLYKLELSFKNGLYQQKVLNSLSGYGRWDVILFDEDGNQMHVDVTGGGIKGFSTGRFSVSPIEFKNGTNSMKTKVIMQFVKAKQFSADLGFIGADTLTFDPDEIEGVNQARLTVPSAPVDSATTVVVKTVLDKDGSTFLGGLVSANFLVKVDGATVTISGVVESANDKTYTITIPALSTGEVVNVSLYDSVESRGVIQVGTPPDDILYQAVSVSTTVVSS